MPLGFERYVSAARLRRLQPSAILKGLCPPAQQAESARLPWVSVRAIFNPNEGQLTAEERAEYEAYVQASTLIGILQAKARRVLAQTSTEPSGNELPVAIKLEDAK